MFKIIIHHQAKEELLNLSDELKGKMANLIDKLENYGQLRMPDSRPLGNGLFELRCIERTNIARTIYAYQKGNLIFLLHSFVKKTQQTPSAAFKAAHKRLKEMLEND